MLFTEYLNQNLKTLTPNTPLIQLLVCLVKMEYEPKISIFGLKLMMKSGLEKIFLKFLHAQAVF